MEFSTFTITNKGQALMAKLLIGTGKMAFTSIRTSSTTYAPGDLAGLTALSNIKQVAPISEAVMVNNVSVRIRGAINNSGLVAGYNIQTIGIYATDPDEGEILYAVARALTSGYMPPNNGVTSSGANFDFILTVASASSVTLEIDPAGVATLTDVLLLENEISNIKGYIGYSDIGIYGVEVDFENKVFTRLAGSIGRTAGTGFDDIRAFGGRRRCNLADNGVVNAYYGDAGYIENGSNGQVMVEQPKFYYKMVPLKIDRIQDYAEVNTVKVTAGASASGDLTITLNGVAFTVAVTAGDSINSVADKIRAKAFSGWTVTGATDSAIFTCTTAGVRATGTFSAASTGVTATVTKNIAGGVSKGFHTRKARYYVSDTPKAGFKVHPAFVRNNVELSKIYLPAYEGSICDVSATAYLLADEQVADFTASTGDKLSSIGNAKPASGLTQDLTRAKTRILANNRGTGWNQRDALCASASQMLMMIEYCAMNMQTAIGQGVSAKTDDGSTNMAVITGSTTNLGNASGMAAGTNGLVSVSYRGEENFWGNIWKWVDGLNIELGSGLHDAWYADNAFADDSKASPYKNAGFTLSKKEGYVSAIGWSETCDFLFLPTEVLGSSAVPVGDYFYQAHANTGWRVPRLGGYWAYGLDDGPFFWLVLSAASSRGQALGGAPVYFPAA